MADEIAQVVELECKGAYYLIKGTKEMIAFAAKYIVMLGQFTEGIKWYTTYFRVSKGNV